MGTVTGASGRDILLAEDDDDDVYIFELALRKVDFSHSLRRAENGERLFVLLRDKIPYLLFLDIEMPCKDGVSCIVEIRKHREYDQLPIIMYTGHFTDRLVEDAYRAGANLYLTKPHSIEELTLKLEKIFAINWKEQLYYPPLSRFVFSQQADA